SLIWPDDLDGDIPGVATRGHRNPLQTREGFLLERAIAIDNLDFNLLVADPLIGAAQRCGLTVKACQPVPCLCPHHMEDGVDALADCLRQLGSALLAGLPAR